MIVLGSISIIFFIPFTIISAVFYFDTTRLEIDFMSRKPTTVFAFEQLLKIVLLIISIVGYDSLNTPWVINTIIILGYLYCLLVFMKNNKLFFNKIANNVNLNTNIEWRVCSAVSLWLGAPYILLHLFNDDKFEEALVFLLCGSLLLILMVLLMSRSIAIKFISVGLENLKNVEDKQKALDILCDLFNNKKMTTYSALCSKVICYTIQGIVREKIVYCASII
jgi:hypothetical protein